ncbi:hypothetical protein C9J21_19160 [Photobacterium phosphoreum]|nr:hypothetical protein C9J21_19160 [Photobacterium phosphoreum]
MKKNTTYTLVFIMIDTAHLELFFIIHVIAILLKENQDQPTMHPFHNILFFLSVDNMIINT